MSEQWTIRLRAQPVTVGGFATVQAAHKHADKHYLNPMERWDQLQPSARESIAKARQIAETHGKVSPSYYAFVATVSVAYLGCVRAETEAAVRVEQVACMDLRGQKVSRIETVTKVGIYAAFSVIPADQVSDLRTAMRQYNRKIKNPRPSDYLDWAHAHLTARLRGARFSDD
ncbi:MAG TPA: hypothetical protein VH165_05115 [Kofleriaceae bacterium]|jgi:hypothetical protein|nr:hypothetical protein [Kofleriaceae bacterium]